MPTMIRPAWTAETPEQAQALAEATQLADLARQHETAMWEAILKARNLGVPDTIICAKTGQSRATLNRRHGPRHDDTGT